uniref:Uncharacterized protein n=1 Tax=Myotis myotis TaxID=51298 RepID=A0A7J8ANA1_MYOMY|nr:hypothetical protein mMyoMyo1_008189 [Myotis myotis]
MGIPLYVTEFLSLAVFKILSLSFALGILIMMCLGVVLFGFLLFGVLCASWTCKSISFTRWGKFSVIISSNRFSISCSLSSSGTPIILMLVRLKLSERLLTLPSHFWILFSFCFSGWVFFASSHFKSLT